MRYRGAGPGYDVFAKVLGRKKAIGRNLSRKSAFGKGALYVDTTPAASFTVKPTNRVASGPEIPGWDMLKYKFRPRRTRKAFNVVEKRKYRIDSLGEMMGLKKARQIDLRRVL